MDTSLELMGSSGGTFWEHFFIEKKLFTTLNRKTWAKHASTWRSIQSVLFEIEFGKKLVADANKEPVFLLSQRKIRCAATFFSGVGGSGRRPLELKKPRYPVPRNLVCHKKI